MKEREEYMVRLGGPDEELEFLLDEKFFAGTENSEWNGGRIDVRIKVIRETGVISLECGLKGWLDIMCDRCLEDYSQDIDTRQILYVKYGEEHEEVDENVIFVTREEHHLNMAPFLQEFLILAMPLKKVHPEREDGSSGCNEQMIEKLNEHLVSETEEETDPRWDELKKLQDKN